MSEQSEELPKVSAAEAEKDHDRVAALVQKYGANAVEIEENLVDDGTEKTVVLLDDKGEEIKRGTLSELEAAEVHDDDQKLADPADQPQAARSE